MRSKFCQLLENLRITSARGTSCPPCRTRARYATHRQLRAPQTQINDLDPVAGALPDSEPSLVGGALTISPASLALFVITTAAVLLLGHSLGNHRKLVHNSFRCGKWLEYLLVYCGVQVGLAGPLGRWPRNFGSTRRAPPW